MLLLSQYDPVVHATSVTRTNHSANGQSSTANPKIESVNSRTSGLRRPQTGDMWQQVRRDAAIALQKMKLLTTIHSRPGARIPVDPSGPAPHRCPVTMSTPCTTQGTTSTPTHGATLHHTNT